MTPAPIGLLQLLGMTGPRPLPALDPMRVPTLPVPSRAPTSPGSVSPFPGLPGAAPPSSLGLLDMLRAGGVPAGGGRPSPTGPPAPNPLGALGSQALKLLPKVPGIVSQLSGPAPRPTPAGTVGGLGATNTAPDILGGAYTPSPFTFGGGESAFNIPGVTSPWTPDPTNYVSLDPTYNPYVGEGVSAGGGFNLGGMGGYVTPALGALYGLATGGDPAHVALNTGLQVAGTALDASGLTLGLGSIAAPFLSTLLGPLFGGGPSHYQDVRMGAQKEAGAELGGLMRDLGAAAGSTNPGDWQSALVTEYGPRNPVRSELWLPPDVAQEMGVTGSGERSPGGPITVQWSDLTPDQFNTFIDTYKNDPARAAAWVMGSGDVGYLDQQAAEHVAARAQHATLSFLDHVTGRPPRPPFEAPYAETPGAAMPSNLLDHGWTTG